MKAVIAGWSSQVARRAHNPKVARFESRPRNQILWRRSLVGLQRPVHTRQVGGSNPPVATKTTTAQKCEKQRTLVRNILRPVGQEVKTSPFHGGIVGSIPARVTTKKDTVNTVSFFVLRAQERTHWFVRAVGEALPKIPIGETADSRTLLLHFFTQTPATVLYYF